MAYLVSPYRPFHLSRLERRALRVHLSDQEDQGIRARPLHPIHPCWMSPSLQKKTIVNCSHFGVLMDATDENEMPKTIGV